MATRIFCDQCGNTISDNRPIVVTYGTLEQINVWLNPNYNGVLGARTQNMPVIVPPPNLDLCKICHPIWIDRVRNLTKASDVSTK